MLARADYSGLLQDFKWGEMGVSNACESFLGWATLRRGSETSRFSVTPHGRGKRKNQKHPGRSILSKAGTPSRDYREGDARAEATTSDNFTSPLRWRRGALEFPAGIGESLVERDPY